MSKESFNYPIAEENEKGSPHRPFTFTPIIWLALIRHSNRPPNLDFLSSFTTDTSACRPSSFSPPLSRPIGQMPSFFIYLFLLILLFPIGFLAQKRKTASPIGPSRRHSLVPSRSGRTLPIIVHPPSIKPPKGVARTLNKAKLKDFMRIGREILRNRRLPQARGARRRAIKRTIH